MKLIFGLMLIIFVSACKKEIEQSSPDILPFDEVRPNQISFLEIPIAFHVSQIEDKINEAIKGTLYADQSFEDKKSDGLKVSIRKVGKIKLSLQDNFIHYSVPLHIWASKRMIKARLFGKKIEKTKEVNFSLRIKLRSELNLNKNWKLETKTNYVGVKWIKKPKVNLLGVRFDLAKILENQLYQKRKELENVIDKATARLKVIEREVQKIWIKIQEPILIEKKVTQGTWLLAEPLQIEASQIEGKNGKLFITIRLHAYLKTIVSNSKEEKPVVSQKPLPTLLKSNSLSSESNDFELHLQGDLPYEAVNDLLDETIKDTVLIIPSTEYKIKVADAEIFGSGKKLYLKLGLKGDINSKVYLNCIPRFDSLDKSLYFDNFDYDLQSEEYLLSAADWMLKSTVKEEIQKLLILPLDKYVKKLPDIIQKGLSKGKTAKTASFDLQNFDLYPRFIQIDREQVRVYVKATGKVGIEIIKL